jgi:tight adherence protein C
LPPIVLAALGFAGIHLSVIIPVWVALVFAAVFFFLPDLELRQQVDKRRQGFPARHRGLPRPGRDEPVRRPGRARGADGGQRDRQGWAFWRIRDALANARITGQTPWQALGVLGEEVRSAS